MREIIIGWTHEDLYSTKKPNADILKTIKHIEQDENLIESEDVDNLFKKLDI